MNILLTHANAMRRQYYGERALAALRALGDVRLHEHDEPLTPDGLIAAARGIDLIVSDRMTAGPAQERVSLPRPMAARRAVPSVLTAMARSREPPTPSTSLTFPDRRMK